MSTEKFWEIADAAQVETARLADSKFARTEDCDAKTLRKLLIQYRFFTVYYIGDLAYLVAKLPFGKLRSFMAHILDEELGLGDEGLAHPELYDAFLRSIGVDDEAIQQGIANNLAMLEDIRQALVREPYPYGVGLRGMGGECMCQIYLDNLYHHFIKNPFIQEHHSQIDWRFWDIHVGPVDVHHREETRALLDKLILRHPELSRQISDGFQASIRTWDQFWTNIVDNATYVETRRYERRASTRRAGAAGELVNNLGGSHQRMARGSNLIPRVDVALPGPAPEPVESQPEPAQERRQRASTDTDVTSRS